MKAREVMTTDVVTIATNTPVERIAELLTCYRISAVPVVEDRNEVVGVVRDEDLFVKERPVPFSAETVPTLLDEPVDVHRLPEVYSEIRHRTAADVMRPDPVLVDADADVGDVVRLMLKRNVKQVFATQQGKLVGVISRLDLLRPLVDMDTDQ